MAEKHTNLILEYEGETEDSRKKIVKEAENIETKLRGKGHEVTLHKTQKEFHRWMLGTASKGLNKIHIVAHGNQAQCGDYNGAGLGNYIGQFIKGKRDLKAITIHSCMSASKHPQTNRIFVRQFASKLLTHMKADFSEYIIVRGSDGESYTDSEGHNWVLKDGVEIPKYRDRDAEEEFLENNTKPRGTARPKYAIHNMSHARGVKPA